MGNFSVGEFPLKFSIADGTTNNGCVWKWGQQKAQNSALTKNKWCLMFNHPELGIASNIYI